ncbi:hypothetical protein KXJ74_09090 [Acinetobacter johnsonii]|nr:hypothetical protein KXJ74_09090 [Acinetobacter johnsonii]
MFSYLSLGDVALKIYSLAGDTLNYMDQIGESVSASWPEGGVVYSPVWLKNSMIYRIVRENIENTDTDYRAFQAVIDVSEAGLSYIYKNTDSTGFYGAAYSNYTGGALINIESYRHGSYGYSLAMLNNDGSAINLVKDFSELRDKKCFILQSNESEIRIISADANINGDANYLCKIIVFNKASQSYSVH